MGIWKQEFHPSVIFLIADGPGKKRSPVWPPCNDGYGNDRGSPTPPQSTYLIEMPHGTCMLITETFGAGMRFGLPVVSEDAVHVD